MTTFKRGYFQYHIMEEMNLRPMSSREIRRMAKELKYGKGSFDNYKDRGYYSSAFKGMNGRCYMTDVYGYGWIPTYCNKNEKYYRLSPNGKLKLEELRKKFLINKPEYFIVIKEYPGSPSKGTKLKLMANGQYLTQNSHRAKFFNLNELENFSEFFKVYVPDKEFTFEVSQILRGEIKIKAKTEEDAFDKLKELIRNSERSGTIMDNLEIDDYEANIVQ